MTGTGDHIILSTRDISKSFPGVRALKEVSCDFYAGQVNAVVGENGAGKSTLMKVICGIYPDFEGSITLEGEPVAFTNPREAEQQGIAIIHQELNLIPQLTVGENIFLGREPVSRLGFIDYRKMYGDSSELLQRLRLNVAPDTSVSKLRVGQQQIVEIAKALSSDAGILIMDEPTSAISEHEIDILFELIDSLREQGVTIIYISHKLDELFRIADHVNILRDGRLIDSSRIRDITRDEIVRKMVGRDIEEFFVKEVVDFGEEILRVIDLSLQHPTRPDGYLVKEVSFSVRKGEVMGIFGLMGAGRSELLECVFGVHPGESTGKIFLDGRIVRIDSPHTAIRAGIGLVPEDRALEGLILGMSVSKNISLANIQNVERSGFVNSRIENKLAAKYIDQLDIRTPSPQQIVEYLSGGNQQKVVIAKWLATNPRILMLDEPTRGIDVNAKNEIYRLISELANTGLGLIVVSSELPEILSIADRIMVLSEGRKTGEFRQAQASEEVLMKAAIPRSM
ncbi:MAG TPA: sugar ABC transporter ATP-binding protein [bacterium]|nr:sugar ABC transporter ATP-binding protein [bacterium]